MDKKDSWNVFTQSGDPMDYINYKQGQKPDKNGEIVPKQDIIMGGVFGTGELR